MTFKESFKYYKSKCPEPDLKDVIDFDDKSSDNDNDDCKKLPLLQPIPSLDGSNHLGILPCHKWSVYEIKNRPGCLFIRNPFTKVGQRYWMTRCLRDYTKSPNAVNLNPNHFNDNIRSDWWKHLQSTTNVKERDHLRNSMRWATLGYHHDWDTKVYSEAMKNKFPDDLFALCQYFASALGYLTFLAEAAIVNFYPIGTTLAGHTDHSEANLEAPLFSFSFGQSAIFLIGGHSKEDKPSALFLRSGDVVVMSKESRLCYHAVPKVFKAAVEPWNRNEDDDELFSDDQQSISKRIKLNETIIDENLWNNCKMDSEWTNFNDYLKSSRININVRQVLKEGQSSL